MSLMRMITNREQRNKEQGTEEQACLSADREQMNDESTSLRGTKQPVALFISQIEI